MYRNLLKELNNSKGLSILEVTLAAGMIAVGALAFMNLTKNQVKTTKQLESKSEEVSVLAQVRKILSNANNCTATFNGVDFSNTNNEVAEGIVTEILQVPPSPGPNTVRFSANMMEDGSIKFGSSGLQIWSISIQNSDFASLILPTVPPNAQGEVNLTLKVLRSRGTAAANTSVNQRIRTYHFPLNITRDATGALTSCYSAEGDGLGLTQEGAAEYTCEVFGGTYQPVGIVPGNPTYPANRGQCQGLFIRAVNNVADTPVLTILGNATISLVSDKKLKRDIKPMNSTLTKINQLKPATYLWKHSASEKRDVGFIAQELEQIFPNIVHRTAGDILSVEYIKLLPLAIKSIQELSAEQKRMKQENQRLKQQIKQLLCQQNIDCKQESN